MNSLDAIYFCYRNLRATNFVVDKFKENFPNSKIALIVDKGGLDFTEYAATNDLYLIDNHDYNLGGTGPNAYLESKRAISLVNRIKRALDCLNADNIMILEDDVYVKQKFEFIENILPAGQLSPTNQFPTHISQKWLGCDAKWGMGGGSVLSKQFFLSIHEEVIDWTRRHHDDLMKEFNCIGAGDCFMSFHFARHGRMTSMASWLQDGHVIHPYKNLYPPGWKSDNQVEW